MNVYFMHEKQSKKISDNNLYTPELICTARTTNAAV